MKKNLILSFSFAVLFSGSINAITQNGQQSESMLQKSCFEGARELVIILDGSVNIRNVGLVNDLTRACENGLITFN